MTFNKIWPIIKQYDQDRLAHILLPLGGIGTGTISLSGSGGLRDFELYDCPDKGFTPPDTCVAIHIRQPGAKPITRLAEGPVPIEKIEGPYGSGYPNHGWPRFRNARFAAAYPLGQVVLDDPEVPAEVRLEAFNPLVAADADASGLPVAVLRYVVKNKTSRAMQVTLAATVCNFIGQNGSGKKAVRNRNSVRTGGGLRGLLLESGDDDTGSSRWGTLALATTNRRGISMRTTWLPDRWGSARLDYWDDLAADGMLSPCDTSAQDDPRASLAVQQTIAARGEKTFTFLITWHFPNRRTWTPDDGDKRAPADRDVSHNIGNYYTRGHADAWAVAEHVAPQLGKLEARTINFVRALAESDVPQAIKESALFNLSTLRSQTCFRSVDGHLYGWEGCGDHGGSCFGSCTHVWNYEHATGFVFGALACDMRSSEFERMTDERGHMSFRISLPDSRAREFGLAAADGQMGAIMRLYREWKLSGDGDFLRRLYPHAKRALAFCWIPGGWDADQDGVMEGCQHNTMDVEYYGPNPQMTGWYLGALRAMEELARVMKDDAFAARCRVLFDRGSAWMDEHLFNGEYYEHHIVPVKSESDIAAGLRHPNMGARNLADPDLQLGPGCLVDQLVGQYTAHVCGLGYLHRRGHVRKTLQSIWKYNWRTGFFDHFNHLRSFVLNDESALLMCTYPRGKRPRVPFPYANEVMTGFEYTAAVGMMYEGMRARGLQSVEAIRERYDGRKRSPFDEAECGHHYARAMAAWAGILAWTGFQYDAVSGCMRFSAPEGGSGTYFWSTGYAWGTVTLRQRKNGYDINLRVIEGALTLAKIQIDDVTLALKSRKMRGGQSVRGVACG